MHCEEQFDQAVRDWAALAGKDGQFDCTEIANRMHKAVECMRENGMRYHHIYNRARDIAPSLTLADFDALMED